MSSAHCFHWGLGGGLWQEMSGFPSPPPARALSLWPAQGDPCRPCSGASNWRDASKRSKAKQVAGLLPHLLLEWGECVKWTLSRHVTAASSDAYTHVHGGLQLSCRSEGSPYRWRSMLRGQTSHTATLQGEAGRVPAAADWAQQSVLPSYHGVNSVELATDGGYHWGGVGDSESRHKDG